MYQVLQDGKPADCCGYPDVHPSWCKSVFDTIEEANEYAYRWAFPVSKGIAREMAEAQPLALNTEADLSYSEFPVMMKIVEVENDHQD